MRYREQASRKEHADFSDLSLTLASNHILDYYSFACSCTPAVALFALECTCLQDSLLVSKYSYILSQMLNFVKFHYFVMHFDVEKLVFIA